MAQLYACARGAPPPELFDAVAVFVPPPADALEIGCGPGNASLPLLERGFRIHAVELGENLAAFARQRLAAFPFTVEVGKFEDASLQAASVDLVVCSSAFHWLDRERALRQAVKVLKSGGALALIWGSARRTAEDDRVDEAIQVAYRAHAPEISRQTVDRMAGKVDEIGQAVRDTPELADFEERLFPHTHLFDRQRYLDTLGTFSDHATLPAEQRPAVRSDRRDRRRRIRRARGAPFHGPAAARAATLERRGALAHPLGPGTARHGRAGPGAALTRRLRAYRDKAGRHRHRNLK
jgi:SAM-dependent methyltransferase